MSEDKRGTAELLVALKQTLGKAEIISQAVRTVEVDKITAAPREGSQTAGNVAAALSTDVFVLLNSDEFTGMVCRLHEHIGELDELDRILVGELYKEHLHCADISPEQYEENLKAKNEAWDAWLDAKEKNDFSVFADAMEKVCRLEKKRVMTWRPADEREERADAYSRMLSEYERGITADRIDGLFTECRDRITALVKRIRESRKQIRTDFLYRRAPVEQQRRLSGHILRIMGFDRSRGSLGETEHPFTEIISKDDIRIATHYYEDNFLSNLYSVLHEGGHALFEQLQPAEDHTHFIMQRKTMGMHESVSRFYENVIGRSRAFIHLLYPLLCELMPQVFFDVSEQELYEAVNYVEPSLIRVDADELTYSLHIIIRYEIEKELINGNLDVRDIPAVWKQKYEKYLGVAPDNDAEGALQDSHWTSDLGYFPTYALGNLYNCMFMNRMREDINVDDVIAGGDLTGINEWMREHVFAKADRLDADEWIKDISGRELTAEDFLTYLENKYGELYGLNDSITNPNKEYESYVQRMVKVKILSAPIIDHITSADEYRNMLSENFRHIGGLAAENRRFISDVIDPILRSSEELTKQEIDHIEKLNAELMDTWTGNVIDLPVLSMMNERLLKDSSIRSDDDMYIRFLDTELSAYIFMISQARHIITRPELAADIRKKGAEVLEKLLVYLDKDRFIKLSPESRELVMVDSRWGYALYQTMTPLSQEEKDYYFDLIIRSMSYAEDSFYVKALPDYDWKYHIYRCYQYISVADEFDNVMQNDAGELEVVAEYGELTEEMWLSDREYFEQIDDFTYVHYQTLRNRFHSGRITRAEYLEQLSALISSHGSAVNEMDDIANNLQMPIDYITAIDTDNITEEQKYNVDKIYRGILSYIFGISKISNMYELMDYFGPLLLTFRELPGCMPFEEFCLQSFAALHPQTYIHSNMVAKINRCLTCHLLKRKPGLFAGIEGCPDAASVPQYAKRIEDLSYHAALCHDAGKLIVIDTVSVYGRKILDSEFDIIKEHPELGAIILEKHDSTRRYADVARGHHLWYDMSHGYPSAFDKSASRLKTIIDITACSDCMDAATDVVGRSYNTGKTLGQFIEEVREGSGTRYAPYLYDLITEPEVYADIEYLLTKGRQEAYRNTYMMLKNVRDPWKRI